MREADEPYCFWGVYKMDLQLTFLEGTAWEEGNYYQTNWNFM